MRRCSRLFGITTMVWLVLAAATAVAETAASQVSEWRWQSVSMVVAIGDVHGAFDAFTGILRAAQLVNDQLSWTGGNSHLVSLGDLIDRGPGSRKVLDLLMRLEAEAGAAGGRVHVILGNHEVMNLVGDLRYVSRDEYLGFVDAEERVERNAARMRWQGDPLAFDQRYPPGFFAHRRAFALDGKYGRWLLSRPVLMVINGIAFMHGGLSDLVGADLVALNRDVRGSLVDILEAGTRLRSVGALPKFGDLLNEAPGQRLETAANQSLNGVWSRLDQARQSPLLLDFGPLWYRGSVLCHPLLERRRLQAALARLQAERVVVGHTPTATRRVMSAQSGLVIQADTGMLKARYRGRAHAVVFEAGGWTVIDADGGVTPFDPDRSPTDALGGVVEIVLTNGSLTPSEVIDGYGQIVITKHEGVSVRARFVPMGARRAAKEVAAYKLDRLIGLNMVPVTVPREYDGQMGALVHWKGQWLSEPERIARRRPRDNACQIGSDYSLSSLFDTLIKHDRPRDGFQYLNTTLALQLTGHGSAFSTSRDLLQYPAGSKPSLSIDGAAALSALNAVALQEEIPELPAKQAKALLLRRDEILKTWPRLEEAGNSGTRK